MTMQTADTTIEEEAPLEEELPSAEGAAEGESAPAPDLIAELRAEFDSYKVAKEAEAAALKAQLTEPQIAAAKAAVQQELTQIKADAEALALAPEEVSRRVTLAQAGFEYIQAKPALAQLAVDAYARELSYAMLPETATRREIQEFEQHVAQYGQHADLMKQAATQWVEGRQYRLQEQQRRNAAARVASGAERVESGGGAYSPGLTARERYIKALREGGPLPSKAEIDHLTASYR